MTDTTEEVQAGTSLAVRRMEPDSWAMIKEQSATLEAAGRGTSILPKGITNRYQIAAILQKGWELGLSPLYSLEQIALVNGKPVVQGQALLALIQSRHGRKAVVTVKRTDEECTLLFQDPSDPDMQSLEVTWTLKDAERAGLTKKEVWKQYPRTMLYWRCLGEGARVYFADTVAGLRLPDEMDLPVTIDSAGNLVIDQDALPEPSPSTQQVSDGEIVASTSEEAAGDEEEEDMEVAASNHLELLQKLQYRLEQLSERRGQGEKWLSLVKLGAGKLGYQGNSPSRLNDEELAGVIGWAEDALGISSSEDSAEQAEEAPAEEEAVEELVSW